MASAEKKQQILYIVQIAVISCMLLFVRIAYKGTLWNQQYVDQVMDDWSKGPIVEFQVLEFDEGGFWSSDTECPSGYEIGTKIYFPGMREGCVCAGSRTFATVDWRRCTDEMLTRSQCVQIAPRSETWFKSVNEALLCIKRDSSYNYFDMTKPVIDDISDTLECPQSDQKLCQSSDLESTELDLENMFCIPASAQCPITDIAYAVSAQATDQPSVMSRNNNIGAPLIEVQYSQGQPCIVEGETNVIEGKQQYMLMTDEWYEGCETSVESQNLSPMFTPVHNFPTFSDYDVIEDNDLLSAFRKLVAFELDELKDYKHELYVKKYHSWEPSCTDDGVSPLTTQEAVDSVSRVDTAARWYYGLLWTQLILVLIGMTANFMRREDALGKKPHGKATKIRFICSTLSGIGILLCLLVIRGVIGDETVAYLAVTDCTNDPVFEDSFKTMQTYLVEANTRFWISMVFLVALLVLDTMQVYNFVKGMKIQENDAFERQ